MSFSGVCADFLVETPIDESPVDLGDLGKSDLCSFGLLVLEKSANTYEAGKDVMTDNWSTLLDLWQDWNK